MTDFAQRLARILADRSDLLFGVPGGGPNLDVIGGATEAGMRFVLAHGETAAAIMASTYGLITGGPTGVVVTRGPGATSVANGAAQATLDRFPLVVITDTVTAHQTPRVSHQRFDQRALFAPITVASATASNDLATTGELEDLIDRASQWPAGAVHLDYDPTAPAAPTDSTGIAAPDRPPAMTNPGSGVRPPWLVPAAAPPVAGELGPALELVERSRRPIVIVGMEAAALDHQARLVGDPPPIRGLLERLGCPVLTTYQAVGLVPTEGPLNAGLYTNGALEQPALDQADLILTIGLDTVEPIPTAWRQNVPVITLSTAEPIDAFIPADVVLVGDLATMAHQLLSAAGHGRWTHSWPPHAAPSMRREARRRLRPPISSAEDTGRTEPAGGLGPVALVDAVGQAVADAAVEPVVTVDAGAHFLALMPLWPVRRPFDLLISNGLATMGFALPAAVGAGLAHPGRPVLAFSGDGGLSMVMAELETIGRLGLPITVVVFNDSTLSLIAVKQGHGHGGPAAIRYAATDFATIAEASGMQGSVVRTVDEVRDALSGSSNDWLQPRLIDARIDPAEYQHLIGATRG